MKRDSRLSFIGKKQQGQRRLFMVFTEYINSIPKKTEKAMLWGEKFPKRGKQFYSRVTSPVLQLT